MKLIKPCPFCGSKKVEVCRTNPDACWIRCGKCGADAPSHKERKKAISIWNRRPLIVKGIWATIVEDDESA